MLSIAEELKLSMIIRNLHTFYQDRLRDPLPSSMNCEYNVKEWKPRKIQSTAEPSSRKVDVLEKDLAFVVVSDDIEIVSPFFKFLYKSTGTCFRCNQVGHMAIGCEMPKETEILPC
ncbi:hypothetical protein JTB14_036603 [Gonioctena quinquepunctata]|nr:hypothetical protein JTB14_036603 [Gonioctena quinquepunctata]